MSGGFRITFRGYDRSAVDAFMARLDGTLGRGPLLGPPVDAAQIRGVQFGTALRGYHHDDVDQALDEALAALGEPVDQPPGPARQAPDDSAPRGAAGEVDAAMAQRVRQVAFTTTILGPGYDEEQVDAFLDRIEAALLGQTTPPTPADIQSVTFASTRLQAGYDQDGVDAFLDELEVYFSRAR